VFGTIAAESQRLINETYSAFVQGFMPTLAAPEADVLDGLTPRSSSTRSGWRHAPLHRSAPPPTPTRCCGSSSAARAAAHRLAAGVLLQRRLDQRSGAVTLERGRRDVKERRSFSITGGMCPALRGPRLGHRHRPVRAVRREQVAQRGRAHDPRLHAWTAGTAESSAAAASSTRTSRSTVHQEGAHDLLHKEPTKIKVDGINLTYRGLIPKIQKSMLSKDVDALQPHIAPS
jgi:hypothetical protein